MRQSKTTAFWKAIWLGLPALIFGLFIAPALYAQEAAAPESSGAQEAAKEEPKPKLDIYGFAMIDIGYQGKQNDPDWFDVVRPTKLPAFANQFGEDGHFFAGVRQSRFGVKSYFPTEPRRTEDNVRI